MPVEKIVTNNVEKLVYDRAAEEKLQIEKQRLEMSRKSLLAKTADLKEENAELKKKLAISEEHAKKLERVVPKADQPKKTGRPAKITSKTTYYDRKNGVVYFSDRVHVDDEQYQMHSDKVYVFMSGTNDVRRIVAIGNVAMTNDTKRAYGAKASYYRQGGMVVLYSGPGVRAEVRDEAKAEDQVVKGDKIKFWIDSDQVEVLDADITAPSGGMGAATDLKQLTGGK